MIVVSENLTIEYKSDDMREESIEQMKDEGYALIKKYNTIDVHARSHLFAEFKNSRKGYVGLSVYQNV
jgi:hypothetical protein